MFQKIKDWWSNFIAVIGTFFLWIKQMFKKLWQILTGKKKTPQTAEKEVKND